MQAECLGSETNRVRDVWRRGCGQREEGTAVPGPPGPLASWLWALEVPGPCPQLQVL